MNKVTHGSDNTDCGTQIAGLSRGPGVRDANHKNVANAVTLSIQI